MTSNLSTKVEMSRQEIFDKVWAGLKAQGFERSVVNDRCRYRGPNGTKCAAGHLIPDEEYVTKMEGGGVYSRPWFKEKFNRNELQFISCLQLIHDSPYNNDPVFLEKELRRFATDTGLTITE